MKKPTIILANDHHRNQAVISLVFEKDHTLISRVKTLPGAKLILRGKKVTDLLDDMEI